MEIKIKSKPQISSPASVMNSIKEVWTAFDSYEKGRENLFILYLTTKNKLMSVELQQGTIDHIHVYPREIIRKALFINASAIILSHNHPSGSTEPSNDDNKLTEKIKQACELMDIHLLDHIIIGDDLEEPVKYYSYQEMGKL